MTKQLQALEKEADRHATDPDRFLWLVCLRMGLWQFTVRSCKLSLSFLSSCYDVHAPLLYFISGLFRSFELLFHCAFSITRDILCQEDDKHTMTNI